MSVTLHKDYAGKMDTARTRSAGKPLANNTRLFDRGEGVMAVQLHQTDVVTVHPDGRVTLDSGGWQTLTTKDRINAFAPVRLWQTDGEWFVAHDRNVEQGEHGTYWEAIERRSVPYFDGITFDADGTVLNGPSPEAWQAYQSLRKERRKALTKFVAKVGRELRKGMDMPSGGGCWFCCGMDPETTIDRRTTRPEQADDDSHLLHHVEEGYVVPSLLVNALREAGYSDTGVYLWLDMKPEQGTMGGGQGDRYKTVQRAVREYLKRRIVPLPPTE